MKYDNKEIESLIELLDKWELTEITIEEGNKKVQIKKQANVATVQPAPSSVPAAPAAILSQESPETVDEKNAIKSPMVGTVYLSPSPGAPNFVSEGAHVNKGDVLCLVEAMKMFNKIKSEKSGKVKKVIVKNEQPVEFGSPLFVIDEN